MNPAPRRKHCFRACRLFFLAHCFPKPLWAVTTHKGQRMTGCARPGGGHGGADSTSGRIATVAPVKSP